MQAGLEPWIIVTFLFSVASEIVAFFTTFNTLQSFALGLAGVAFAMMELRWYFANVAQAEQAEGFLIAAEHLPENHPKCLEFEREAKWRFEGLFSRSLWTKTQGRPSLGLERAIAQHLRSGCLAYSKIGRFMDITSGAAEMRCRTADMRSVVSYEDGLGGQVADV